MKIEMKTEHTTMHTGEIKFTYEKPMGCPYCGKPWDPQRRSEAELPYNGSLITVHLYT